MSEEKPLHVRVAEALGWTNLEYRGQLPCVPPIHCWSGRSPGEMVVGQQGISSVPHYDTDWSATGPLIPQYVESLFVRTDTTWGALARFTYRFTSRDGLSGATADGPTPLIAVCNLILALKEAGKL